MSTAKRDDRVTARGPRAEHTLVEERPHLFLAGDITEEYLPRVRIVTLPVMMASADATAPTSDPACSTQTCPDSTTLLGCGETPTTDTDTTTTPTTSTTTDTTPGTGSGGTSTGGTSPGGY
jgi:hypothetical protein